MAWQSTAQQQTPPERDSLLARLAVASTERDNRGRPQVAARGWVVSLREPWPGGFLTTIEPDGAPASDAFTALIGQRLEAGGLYTVRGAFEVHPRYGERLVVTSYDLARPSSEEGVRRYLASGIVPQLAGRRAEFLVRHLGARTLDVLDGPEDEALSVLTQIPGITPERARVALDAWRSRPSAGDVAPELYRYGLTAYQVRQLLDAYGAAAPRIIREEPYRIPEDVDGFGFRRADEIALRAGLAENATSRVRAGILWTLTEASAGEGHTYLPSDDIMARLTGKKGLGIHATDAEPIVAELLRATSGPVVGVCGSTALATARLAAAEASSAERILAGLAGFIRTTPPEALHALDPDLTAEQCDAAALCADAPVAVLTGGPGVGKTRTLSALLQLWRSRGERVTLAAPTGKAAMRMTEATGWPATTVHRLLGYSPDGGFARNAQNQLPGGHLVVDESSMLDAELATALLDAIDWTATTLTLVGDVDQLPSVGPGQVLRDVIESGRVPVARLSTVMRQAAGSRIVVNAHAINRGELPDAGDGEGDWVQYIYPDETDSHTIADRLVYWITEILPARRPGVDLIRDVQVLAPMHRDRVGVAELNMRLQATLNPCDDARPGAIRLGDKVIQTANDYKLAVFNGETGIVVDVSAGELLVDLGGRMVVYPRDGASRARLELAYATTIHKYQGSEAPVVVLPVHQCHAFLWARSLFYTAATRAKSLCCVIGTERAIRRATRNNETARRNTRLAALLR